jgi:hypothetical protein
MSEDKKKILTEGIEKRGGLNKPPEKPKPNFKPVGQKPSASSDKKPQQKDK